MDSLTFNEIEMKDLFVETLLNAFKNDPDHEEDYWYNLFGQREMQYYDSLDDSSFEFPCFHIDFYPRVDVSKIHSTEIEQYSYVSFYLQTFNQRVGEDSKERIGTLINYKIKQTLQKEFHVIISENQVIPNLYDKQVYRRIIRGSFGFDNKNKIFYQGV